MKPYILIAALLVLPILPACVSSKSQLNKGNYDTAISISVKKLKKKPFNEKQTTVLREAYRLSNIRDLDRIAFLKASGKPDIWEEVFITYDRLKRRQDIVKTLPVNILSAIGYNFVSYDNDVIEAEKKACEYFYAHAVSLLEKGTKPASRQAYGELSKVKSHFSDYRDVDALMERARSEGMTWVLFSMKNDAYVVLPESFEDELLKISLKDIGSFWVQFDTRAEKNRNYDYLINLSIKHIDVSPERIKETNWEEFRQVEDGWQYVLDANGNVMKDSLGNDIKTIRYKTIKAFVRETRLAKSAILSASVDLYTANYTQLLKSERITAESIFDYAFITAYGDLDALKKETAQRLGYGPAPFPNDFEMILMANDYLKSAARSKVISFNPLIY